MSFAPSLNVKYVYPFSSALEEVAGKPQLRLATSGGIETNPYFFRGFIQYPRRTADMLLACSLVSRTRFYSPTELRERRLAAADPVVTSGGGRLRFEAFSVCCGVYCRLDLNPQAIDGEWTGRGTTNVDFNPPMRSALATLLDSDRVGINVGEDRLVLESGAGSVVERKVKLPVRWLKGFVEVQAYQARLKPTMEVSATEVRQFLRTVPQQITWQRGSSSFIVPSGRGIRLSQREAANCVPIGAPGRLKVLEEILRHSKTVRIYAGPEGVTGWEVCTPEASFHLVLSPDASRGFSGEGQALEHLVSGDSSDLLARVRAALQWQAKIDPLVLASQLGMDASQINSALAVLGTRGLVGYDLAEATYFHRELPFDLEVVEELHPRIQKARKLVEEGSVRISKCLEDEVDAYVKGDGADHRVMLSASDARCTCPWYSKHPGERGPCSHILAVEIASNDARKEVR